MNDVDEKYHKLGIVEDDDMSIKLDCAEKIVYKLKKNIIQEDIAYLFLRDINFIYHKKMKNYYVNHQLLNQFYDLRLEYSKGTLNDLLYILNSGDLPLVKTRFDLLDMYGCKYLIEKQEVIDHLFLILHIDNEYVYVIEDYYMLKEEKIITVPGNQKIYMLDRKNFEDAIAQYCHIYLLQLNHQETERNDRAERILEFLAYSAETYRGENHGDMVIGRKAIEHLINSLKEEPKETLANNFFNNHFIAHLMYAKRKIFRQNIEKYVEKYEINSLCEELFISENYWDRLKSLIYKNTIKIGNTDIVEIAQKYIVLLQAILTVEDKINEEIKTLVKSR